jgi:outer membrane protein OmpA-like peptidoglycan-associated protein
VDTVAAALSQHAGIRTGSAARILGLATPILMSLLGQRVRSDNMSVGGLSRWVGSLKGELRGIPASLLHDAGLDQLREEPVASSRTGAPQARPVGRGAVPVGIGVVLLFGLWVLLVRRPAPEPPVAEGLLDSTPAPAPSRAAADPGEFVRLALPNGGSLNLPGRGVEVQLIEFIEDRTQPLEPPRWFAFDRLLFETNSATLLPWSDEQLQNIAQILQAYPSVHLKIGGYTDSTGNLDANRTLSQERATKVMNELVRLGVSQERVASEGYGGEHSVADDTTEAGRAQNRRMALRVARR